MPHGFIRNKTKAKSTSFTPASMIDVLYDYQHFLSTNEKHNGTIAQSGPESLKRIAIIGAGAGGLIAAYELSKIANINVSLIEASDRLGGRMDSIYIADGDLNDKVFEMGCMRFPPTSHTLYYYLNKFDLPTTPNFPDPGIVNTKLLYQNKVIDWPANSATPINADFERIGHDFSNMVVYLLGDVNNPNITAPSKLFDYWHIYQTSPTENNKKQVVSAWQTLINQYGTTSYFDAVYSLAQNSEIVSKPWTQEDMNKFGALGVGSGGFDPIYNVNFVEVLRLFANGWEDNQELVLSGIGALVDALSDSLNEHGVEVQLNSKVTEIAKQDGKYRITISQECGDNTVEYYDAVIVATTTRAMELMGLTLKADVYDEYPILHQSAKTSIRNLHLMNSSKFFVTTASKFWYAANNPTGLDLPFNIQTDELMRGLYCLNYDKDLDDGRPNTEGKGVVLISYVWGDDSTKILGLSNAERYQQFLLAIKEVDSTFANLLENQTEKIDVIDWESEPHYHGAFKLNYPGQEQDNHAAFFQYQAKEQGVFLAGDSVSWAGGWLEGAMSTAINSACAAAAYVGATVADNSPLTEIASHMYKYDIPPKGPR